MASIERRKDRKGTWRARWREYPGAPQRTQNFARKADAEAFLDGVRADLRRGTYVPPELGQQSFLDFADEWAAAQDRWKGTTADAWLSVRKRLVHVGELEGVALAAIGPLSVKTVRRRLRARYALSTTNNTMGWVSMILRAAHADGRIARNPAAGLEPLQARADEPDGTVGPDNVPTSDEATAVLGAAPAPYRAAVALGIAGLRRGEVLGLSDDRIDLDRRLVTVDRQLVRMNGEVVLTTPKREKARTIEVPQFVAVELRRHLRDHFDSSQQFDGAALLFQGRPGTTPMVRPSEIYRLFWRPALVAAGLAPDRFKFHALRHFCASSLLANGADVATVAGHLGDTVEEVQRTYVHWLRDNRGVPAAILERMLAPAANETATGS